MTGDLVAKCMESGETLESLPLSEYRKVCPLFDEKVYDAISLAACVNGRTVYGGPAPENVRAMAKAVREEIAHE